MAKAIFLAPTGEGTGLTTVALGLVHALDRQGIPVGFCKPITQLQHGSDTGPERSTLLVQAITNLQPPQPLPVTEAEDLFAHGQENQLLDEVIARYQQASDQTEIIVVEGLVPTREQAYASAINAKIVRSLDAAVIIVAAPGNKSNFQLEEAIRLTAQGYGGIDHERMLGCILNQVDAPIDSMGQVRIDFVNEEEVGGQEEAVDYCAVYPVFQDGSFAVLGCIPWRRSLVTPRVKDVVRLTGASLFNEGQLERRVTHVGLAAHTLSNCTDHLRPGALVITPGDRDDMLMAACMAALDGIHIAALLMTGGLKPDARIIKLCEHGLDTGLPVLSVPYTSMQVVLNIRNMSLEIPPDDRDRIQRMVQSVAGCLDLGWTERLLTRSSERRLSPPAFRYFLIERARQANKRIVLPEGDEPRTIQAAVECQKRGIAHCILLGEPGHIQRAAARRGIKIPDSVEVLNPEDHIQNYIEPMVELRKNKGLTPEVAEEELQDSVVLGTMMLKMGAVDGLVSGAVHTTANTIRPALQLIKTVPGSRIVSSIFFMCLPEQVLVYGDCAVNPDPNAQMLADIAIQSADSAEAFGVEPRIAMLSYSTGASGSGSDVEKVREATRLARERRPELLIDGPLQYDAAAIKAVAQSKAPDSRVAGRATVFIFPDLNTGNTTYKAVQRSADVISIGPMLQGLRKPVNDLSRGALVDDIVFTIALTAIQAKQAVEQGWDRE